MEDIKIKGSHDIFFVPSVHFDGETGVCEISGESYLEETVEFYAPLISWLKEYIKTKAAPITMNIKLTYFNTSSSRCILDMLNVLKEYEEDGGKVEINWYYDKDDIDMEEEVEDYILDTDLKINLVPFEEEHQQS